MIDGLDVRALERALHSAGLSRRQARALLHGGLKSLVGETQAEATALQFELQSLREQMNSMTIEASRN